MSTELITPTIRGESVDVKVLQQLSNFIQTTTGVNASPTLIERELDSAISAQSGDVIVLGDLSETKTTNSQGVKNARSLRNRHRDLG